jgi:hypothetical protein
MLYLINKTKTTLDNMHQGIDCLEYVLFPNHGLLHTSTRQRMQRRLEAKYVTYLKQQAEGTHMDQCLPSYPGILSHANACNLTQSLKNAYWIGEPA